MREAAAAAAEQSSWPWGEPGTVSAEQSRGLREDTATAQDCCIHWFQIAQSTGFPILPDKRGRGGSKKSEFSFRISLSFIFSLEFEFKFFFPIISFY